MNTVTGSYLLEITFAFLFENVLILFMIDDNLVHVLTL